MPASTRSSFTCKEIHARRADEGGDELVGGMVVELQRRADLRDMSPIEHDDAVGERHRLDLVVRDIDHRRPERRVQLGEFEAHLHAQLRVEIGERLVEQEHLGLAHQRAADRDPLPLAAGEFGRAAVEQRLELQNVRDFERPRVLDFARRAGDRQREGDILRAPSYADRAHRTGTPSRCGAWPAAFR